MHFLSVRTSSYVYYYHTHTHTYIAIFAMIQYNVISDIYIYKYIIKNMNEKETPSFYHFLLKPSISLTFQKQKVSITFLFSFLVVDKYFQSIHRNYFLSIAWLVHLIFLLCHCNLLIDT